MSIYERVADKGPGLRLHLNENTGGCSPAVLEAIRTLTAEDIAFYPSYEAVEREAAAYIGVPRDWMTLVNGLDEGLHLVTALALRPAAAGPARSVIPEPAFEMYSACTAAAGGLTVRVPPRPGFDFPLEEIQHALADGARLLYLTNPNNPTGRTVSVETIAALAGGAPHATVLVDEAYIDFGGETALPLLDRHRNVMVGRTFAKAFGLAALRVGAVIAHPDTLAPLRPALPPYTLNVAAAAGLRAALADLAWRDAYVAAAAESRTRIYAFCRARGLHFYESAANFVLVRVGTRAASLVAALAERGIFIRDRSTQPGCEGCVRITAGLVAHTDRCLEAMGELL